MKLVFAQGNPDAKYAKTRHNTGFMLIDAYGEQHDALWHDADKFNARMAEITVNDEKVLLIKPLSYYNDTGLVARRIIDFYKANPASDFLVIHDDLALPLGTIRVRTKGSDAGNNGIKSLNAHVGDAYTRIRVGIWTEDRNRVDDVDFVLSAFPKKDQSLIDKDVTPHVAQLIDQFIAGSLEANSTSL